MTLNGVSDSSTDLVTSLLNFTYSATDDPVQTFYLNHPQTINTWHTVQLDIHNNHGEIKLFHVLI